MKATHSTFVEEVRISKELPTPEEAKRIRLSLRLSLRDVALMCGLSENSGSTVQRWEQGLTKPRWKTMLRWASALEEIQDGGVGLSIRPGQIPADIAPKTSRPSRVTNSKTSDVALGFAGAPIYLAVRCIECGSPEAEPCRSATGRRVAWHTVRRSSATNAARAVMLLSDPDAWTVKQQKPAPPNFYDFFLQAGLTHVEAIKQAADCLGRHPGYTPPSLGDL